MKSPKKNGIGEVVTDYGRRVMRIFKKGLLQRSLFDFYGDIKADSVKIKESSSVPGTPVDGDGGVVYIKSADGKLYFKSNEVSEVELSSQGTNTTYSVSCVDGDNSDEEKIRLTGSDSSTDDVVLEAGTGLSIARDGDKITFTNTVTDTDTVLTTEQVQDIVGAMFSSNTETNITVTYQDADGTIDLVATDTNTQLTTEEVQDIVGAMFTSNTETRISATYEDSDGTIDLVVDDMTADTNTNVGNADMTLSGTRNINTSDNTFQIKNGSTVYLEFDDSGITTLTASSDLDIGAHEIRASKFQSDVTTGTAPLTVASTTAVANLQAATATTLHTARNIGGVSFNGSANIDLPGVNTSGNQNTSGNAATATLATNAQGVEGATDADVTITSDGEVTIKLDSDNDESNQKFKITNNADSVVFSVQEDGIVNMAGGTINIDGSNSNLELNSGSDFILEADNNGGSGASSIQYPDSGGTNRIMLAADNDVVILSNRAANGTVQIRANTSSAGGSGEVTVLTVEDDSVTAAAPLFINAGGPNVAITCTSSDADCMVRVSDNSTAGTNAMGMVGTGDDLIMRNDEGNFKVKMANNATETLSLDQSGNLDITGNILPGITYVKILPSDFVPDDVGRPAMIDDTGSDRWLESFSTAKLFASVDIPPGFKATHVDIYGSGTSAVTVYEADVNSKTVTSKGTGNIGTQINITDVNSDATNYILIELAQASGEEVYGGKLTIAKI
jgi:hypothetical protein